MFDVIKRDPPLNPRVHLPLQTLRSLQVRSNALSAIAFSDVCAGKSSINYQKRARLHNDGCVRPRPQHRVRFSQTPDAWCVFKCLGPIQVLGLTTPSRCPPPSSPSSLTRSCHPERRGGDDGSIPATNSSRRHSAQRGHWSRPSGGQAFRTTAAAGILDIFDAVHGGEPFWEKTEQIEAWRRRGTTHSLPTCGVLFRR